MSPGSASGPSIRFGGSERGRCHLLEEDALAAEPRLWIDLAAEWDARLLLAHLVEGDRGFSAEFHAFLRVWAEDEERHAEGLLRLYSLVTGEPPTPFGVA